MKDTTAEIANLLAKVPSDGISYRQLIWIKSTAGSGSATEFGYWTDTGTAFVPVKSGATGLEVTRTFAGDGTVIRIPKIEYSMDLKVRSIIVELSYLDPQIRNMYQNFNIQHADVEIYEGFKDPQNDLFVSPPESVFQGKIDIAKVLKNTKGILSLSVASHLREYTRTQALKRSSTSLKKRAPNDDFYQYVGSVPNWKRPWMQEDKA